MQLAMKLSCASCAPDLARCWITVLSITLLTPTVLESSHLSVSRHFFDVIWVAVSHHAGCIEVIMHQFCTRSGQVCPVSHYSVSKCSVWHIWRSAVVSVHCCGTSSCWSPDSLHWHHHAPVVYQIWPGIFSFKVLSALTSSCASCVRYLGRCVQCQSAQKHYITHVHIRIQYYVTQYHTSESHESVSKYSVTRIWVLVSVACITVLRTTCFTISNQQRTSDAAPPE